MNICIEGIDGVGKDSVAKLVAQHIGGTTFNFPNDKSPTGALIRSYLKGKWLPSCECGCEPPDAGDHDEDLGALVFQALHVVNKLEVLPELARTARDQRTHVVLSRYWPSAFVYGALDGLDREWLMRAHQLFLPTCAAYVLLDAPEEMCMERRAERDGALPPERYEGKLETLTQARGLYRGLWQLKPAPGTWATVDASQPLEDVVKEVCYVLGV